MKKTDLIICAIVGILVGALLGHFLSEREDTRYRRDIIAIEEQVDAERVQYLQDSRVMIVHQMANGTMTERNGAIQMARLDTQEKAFSALRIAERKIRFMRIAGCTDDAETLVKRGLIRSSDVESFAELNYCEK